jgi:hypothetical protein
MLTFNGAGIKLVVNLIFQEVYNLQQNGDRVKKHTDVLIFYTALCL